MVFSKFWSLCFVLAVYFIIFFFFFFGFVFLKLLKPSFKTFHREWNSYEYSSSCLPSDFVIVASDRCSSSFIISSDFLLANPYIHMLCIYIQTNTGCDWLMSLRNTCGKWTSIIVLMFVLCVSVKEKRCCRVVIIVFERNFLCKILEVFNGTCFCIKVSKSVSFSG